ncbi:MAG: penicillin-binding transpeptidase domain-containing protein [Flavobacteriaceae bacterium]
MAKQNEYENKRTKALRWGYIFVAVVLVTFMVFIGRIAVLQNDSNVKDIEKNYIQPNYKEDTVKAARGNLYASDGSILATTVIKYNIFIDFKVIKDTVYEKNIEKLTDSLNKIFGKPRRQYRSVFDQQKKKNNQYYSLVTNLDFEQMNRLKRLPIFSSYNPKTKEYKKNRCLIIEPNYKRILATNQIGSGTIGVDRGSIKSGFEGAFSKYLSGQDGFRLVQRVNATQWKPIDYWKVKEPVDGQDVYTTLDLRIQDIAHSALEKQLIAFQAHHGSVLVMEVETGKVRAMVNLRRNEEGQYVDAYNYALKDVTEPGSTFKVVSLLAAMDDGFVDENTKVDTGDGTWNYAGQKISDGHGGGLYEISDILAQSSNVGSAKLIVKSYAENPKIFINHLKRWKMFDKMELELPGVTRPFIVTPENPRWNKATLASLSYGYASSFNLLQLTTFYNGIANKGKMVKPLFIDKIMRDGKVLYEAKPEVMVNKMASDKAIKMMTEALTKAVEKGTAKSIFTPNLKMAGKTGTARFEYWKEGGKYQASFAGFYPADNPKYTCMVMVNQPQGNYYGGVVAAPVFKEIAGKTFLKTPLNMREDMLKDQKVDLKKMTVSNPKIKINGGQMPELVGLIGKNIVPQLENLGYRVEYKGVGKILEQFPEAGTVMKKDQKIYLRMQN